MAKTITFAGAHFTVAFSVGYALTGSAWVGGALAIIEPSINTIVFYFHEKIWQRVEARRTRMLHGNSGQIDMLSSAVWGRPAQRT